MLVRTLDLIINLTKFTKKHKNLWGVHNKTSPVSPNYCVEKIKRILWWKLSFSVYQAVFSINARRANFSMIYCQLALAKLGVNKTRENDGRSNQGEYQRCIRRETQIFINISTKCSECMVSLGLSWAQLINALKRSKRYQRYLTICSDKFIEYSFPLCTMFCII